MRVPTTISGRTKPRPSGAGSKRRAATATGPLSPSASAFPLLDPPASGPSPSSSHGPPGRLGPSPWPERRSPGRPGQAVARTAQRLAATVGPPARCRSDLQDRDWADPRRRPVPLRCIGRSQSPGSAPAIAGASRAEAETRHSTKHEPALASGPHVISLRSERDEADSGVSRRRRDSYLATRWI